MTERRLLVKENISVGGVFAYTRGQSIEQQAVTVNGWDDYVVSADTKEGRELQAEITGRPVSDFETATASTPTSRRAADKSES
jgi:hypothetical protein